MKYKPLFLEHEVLKRYSEAYPKDKKIEKIIKDAIILCNRSREFNRRFSENMDGIIKPLSNALKALNSLKTVGNAYKDRENAMQSLGVIIHDLVEIRKGNKGRDYHPHLNSIAQNGAFVYTPTIAEEDRNYLKDYEYLINDNITAFSEKDVLKIATACILEEIRKKDWISGRKTDNAKMIISHCFKVKSIGLRYFDICAIQDDDKNICLVAPNAYTDKINFKNSKIILIKNNKAEIRPF